MINQTNEVFGENCLHAAEFSKMLGSNCIMKIISCSAF